MNKFKQKIRTLFLFFSNITLMCWMDLRLSLRYWIKFYKCICLVYTNVCRHHVPSLGCYLFVRKYEMYPVFTLKSIDNVYKKNWMYRILIATFYDWNFVAMSEFNVQNKISVSPTLTAVIWVFFQIACIVLKEIISPKLLSYRHFLLLIMIFCWQKIMYTEKNNEI